MEDFANNIKKYILKGDEDTDIDTEVHMFEIIKFDYRSIFNKGLCQSVNYGDILHKIFEVENKLDLEMNQIKAYYEHHQHKWKELFIFFTVMPFTEYEFLGPDGRLINPDNLPYICPSHASDNILMQTFADIEFDSRHQEIPDCRFANILQQILQIDIFSNSFNREEVNTIIASLLSVGFQLKYKLVTDLQDIAESSYKNNFMNYLYRPICEYVAALLLFEVNVEDTNAVGHNGVHTKVPHQTNDIFRSYPDIVAYDKWGHRRSLAVVEVKKLPILKGDKQIDFKDKKMHGFLEQLVAEMLSDHTNKGILTDSYTMILVEIDIERSLSIKENKPV